MRDHGRRVTYMFGQSGNDRRNGCRCDDCTDANTAYVRDRRIEPRRMIDARRVADHLEQLARRGMGNRAVSRKTGINTGVLHRIRSGDTSRVHRITADRIFALGGAPAQGLAHFRDPLPTPAAFVAIDWHRDAACRDADLTIFFPGRGDSTEPAKAICRGCPVRESCLDYSLQVGLRHGIYGGMTERDRRRLRRQRMDDGEVAA